jgi:hypothetical protein
VGGDPPPLWTSPELETPAAELPTGVVNVPEIEELPTVAPELVGDVAVAPPAPPAPPDVEPPPALLGAGPVDADVPPELLGAMPPELEVARALLEIAPLELGVVLPLLDEGPPELGDPLEAVVAPPSLPA